MLASLIGTVASSRPSSRYWVGGTANWDTTAGTKWAYSSGGTGGARVPTKVDNVYIDANSGAVTVTVATANSDCRDLDFTGFTGTFAVGSVNIGCYGSLYFSSTMTLSFDKAITFLSVQAGKTITTSGKLVRSTTNFNGSNGTWTLQDDYVTNNKALQLTQGTFNDNGYDITITSTVRNSSSTLVVNKSGVWTVTGSGDIVDWFGGGSTFTLNDTGQFKLTNNSSSAKNFNINGKTCYDVWNNTLGGGAVVFYASSTYNTIKSDAGRVNKFENGKTHTVAGLDMTGTAGNLITITSLTAAVATISCPNAINTDYCTISNITFTGGGTWHAGANSVDGGGNTGILFP